MEAAPPESLCPHCGEPNRDQPGRDVIHSVCTRCGADPDFVEAFDTSKIRPELVEPEFSAEQSEELTRVDYLLAELKSLVNRGLVTGEALGVVVEEKELRRRDLARLGRGARMVTIAKHFASKVPAFAVKWAGLACETAPERVDGWLQAVAINQTLGNIDAAIELCHEGELKTNHPMLFDLRREIEQKAKELGYEKAYQASLNQAQAALDAGDFDTAIAAARTALKHDKTLHLGWQILADAFERTGRYGEALDALEAWRHFTPKQFLREQAEQSYRLQIKKSEILTPKPPQSPDIIFIPADKPAAPESLMPHAVVRPIAVPVGLHWREVASEFLEDHWQKLILGLAVALIVVSSTVGSAIVLGDLLWRPEGKVLLAVVYTSLFAAFGRGLLRWGAERAGRIMSLTTLLILPVNFALVGELPVSGSTSAASLGVMFGSLAALSLLGTWLGRALRLPGGGWTIAGFLALGIIDALTPRTASFSWGFPAIVFVSVVFLASVEWMHRKRAADGLVPFEGLLLLGFAFLWAIVRIGGTVLHLTPTLYALPLILAGIASVRIAEGFVGRAAIGARFLGFALTALAFALALARPPAPSALYSGNTLATALLALGLFIRCLKRERLPAYLHAGFAALVLCYFGSYDFLKDLISTVEGAAAHALGYGGRKLPFAYRALNGLVFNGVLVLLAQFFVKRWQDNRLAVHCHRIGVPMAVGACLLGSLEPWAALITFGGYWLGFAVAAWMFEAAWVVYLSCIAFAGLAITAGDLRGVAGAECPMSLSFYVQYSRAYTELPQLGWPEAIRRNSGLMA